jgi:hypothetical protein
MPDMDSHSTASLILSVQRAMLGEVTGNLAALTAGCDGRRVRLAAYFFVAPTEEDQECVQCMASGVIAGYVDGYIIETTFHALGDGTPRMADFWAFIRSGVEVS